MSDIENYMENDDTTEYKEEVSFDYVEKEAIQYLKDDLINYNTASSEDNLKIVKEYQETHSKEAFNWLILHNMPLVFSIAKRYVGISSYDYDDLVQAGTIGLMRAIEF